MPPVAACRILSEAIASYTCNSENKSKQRTLHSALYDDSIHTLLRTCAKRLDDPSYAWSIIIIIKLYTILFDCTPHTLPSKRNGSRNRRDKLLHTVRSAAGGHPDLNDAVANPINPIQDCCWVPCKRTANGVLHQFTLRKCMYCLLASRSLVGVGLKLRTFKRLNLPFNFRRRRIRKHTQTHCCCRRYCRIYRVRSFHSVDFLFATRTSTQTFQHGWLIHFVVSGSKLCIKHFERTTKNDDCCYDDFGYSLLSLSPSSIPLHFVCHYDASFVKWLVILRCIRTDTRTELKKKKIDRNGCKLDAMIRDSNGNLDYYFECV